MTTTTRPSVASTGTRKLGAEASALADRFPPSPVPDRWPVTCLDRQAVSERLLAPPFRLDRPSGQRQRRFGLLRVLEWLEAQPGATWQQRWTASGAGTDGRLDWRRRPLAWLKSTGRVGASGTSARQTFGAALSLLICGDVIRPDLAWLLRTTSPATLTAEMARVRDPDGFATLQALSQTGSAGVVTTRSALVRIAYILAAKGGTVRDITVGDSLELVEVSAVECDQHGRAGKGSYFYQLLHAMGVFPPDAPPTVRMFSSMYQGQLTPEQLIDRYSLACRPVRDLLVDYLRERQPGVDFNTLTTMATNLGLLFWKDLETHHPGITSLRLAPDIAAAWKQRIRTTTTRSASRHGGAGQAKPRKDVAGCLNTVRAFYLDIAHWATEDPGRWGPWAFPCPVRVDDLQSRKERSHRKSRMYQRTRERLPVLAALIANVSAP